MMQYTVSGEVSWGVFCQKDLERRRHISDELKICRETLTDDKMIDIDNPMPEVVKYYKHCAAKTIF